MPNQHKPLRELGEAICAEMLLRFVSKDDDGCWLWTRARMKNGYGVIRIPGTGKVECVHRVAWRVWRKEEIGELFVLHRCDKRACINPEHLFLGTHVENQLDKQAKGRTPHGQNHFCAVLTEGQVLRMRKLWQSGWTGPEIAEEFCVKLFTAYDAVRGRNWKHLNRHSVL